MKIKKPLREEILNLSSTLNEENHNMNELLRNRDIHNIYIAGEKKEPWFDYKRGLDAILEKDENLDYVCLAGEKWPKGSFDYKRGFDTLIKKDRFGAYIAAAGETWPIFNYAKGLDALIEKDKTGYAIMLAGSEWPVFDFRKGFYYLLKKDETGDNIYEAGKYWRRFDYGKAFRSLRKLRAREQGKDVYYHDALDDWPKEETTKEKLRISAAYKKKNEYYIRKEEKVKKHPLREEILNLSNVLNEEENKEEHDMDKLLESGSAHDIWIARTEWPKGTFDFKRGFESIIEKDEKGLYIYKAGVDWKGEGSFDYKKGFDALIKKDRFGAYTAAAGEKWPIFNYAKGFHYLIKKDKIGIYIYDAGKSWRRFDHRKGFRALKKVGLKANDDLFYRKAINDWPKEEVNKERERTKNISYDYVTFVKAQQSLKRKEEKIKKKHPLREEIKNLSSILSKEKYDMDELLRRGLSYEIVEAGRDWPKGTFDYKRGFDFLIEKDERGYAIIAAGSRWDEFNYAKGLDALIKIDKTGNLIEPAGSEWPVFDYRKGLYYLIQKDKEGYSIYKAGIKWRRFDYPKAFRALRKIGDLFYRKALNVWPKEEVEKEKARKKEAYNKRTARPIRIKTR